MKATRFWGLLALAFCLVLSGGAVLAAAAKAPVTLTFMTWDNNEQEKAGNMAIINKFLEKNPDIKIEMVYATFNDYPSKVLTMAAGGVSPDVLWVGANMPDFASQGLLLNLDPLIKKDADFDARRYFPGALTIGQYNGSQYGLIRDVSTFNVFYNRDMFDAAGLPAPPKGWTYDDLLSYSKKLTKADEKKFAFGLLDRNRWAVIDAFGGKVANADWSAFAFDEKALQAIQFEGDYRMAYHYDAQGSELPGWAGDQFPAQQVAMFWDGPWSFKYSKENYKFNWDIAMPPAGPSKMASLMMGLSIGVSATSKNPDAAYRLVKFLCYDPDAQVIQVTQGIASPSIRDQRVIKAVMESPSAPPNVAAYLDTMNYMTPAPDGKSVGMTQALTRINDAVTKVLNGQATAANVIPAAVKSANAILAQARKK